MTRTPEEIQADITAAMMDVGVDGYYTRLGALWQELNSSISASEVPLWALHSLTFAQMCCADRARRDGESEQVRAGTN